MYAMKNRKIPDTNKSIETIFVAQLSVEVVRAGESNFVCRCIKTPKGHELNSESYTPEEAAESAVQLLRAARRCGPLNPEIMAQLGAIASAA